MGYNSVFIHQGYAPDTTILDGASGLVKGHEEVLANTKIRHDHFHIIKDMKDCGMFLQNEIASTVTETLKLYNRANKGSNEIKKSKFTEAWNTALTKLGILEDTYNTFQLLVHWLQYEVLQLAGYPPEKRAMLYDFIIAEL